MSTYLVTAYRWGNTNDHQYAVYCGPDVSKAIALARCESDDRGGKYDCAVYEFDADGTEYKLVAYTAGYGDQTSPKHSWSIDYFKSLGHDLLDYANGGVWLRDPDRPGHLKYTKVEPPQLVLDLVKRKRDMFETLADADARRREYEARQHGGSLQKSNRQLLDRPDAIDSARLDFLQRLIEISKNRGFKFDALGFHTGRPIREQIDAMMAAHEVANETAPKIES